MIEKTSKSIFPLIIEEYPIIITDGKKHWRNNWRKLHKLSMRRKGSSLVVIKMKFEHNTTKKQKRRWRKKHLFR